MAMTVKISTEKTKSEKQRLLMSLIRFCPMGSALGLESFIGWDGTEIQTNGFERAGKLGSWTERSTQNLSNEKGGVVQITKEMKINRELSKKLKVDQWLPKTSAVPSGIEIEADSIRFNSSRWLPFYSKLLSAQLSLLSLSDGVNFYFSYLFSTKKT